MVADGDGAHAGPDGLDDAGALVAEHHWRVNDGTVAFEGVQVGAADTGGGQPDQDLTGTGLGDRDFLDLQRFIEVVQDRGAH